VVKECRRKTTSPVELLLSIELYLLLKTPRQRFPVLFRWDGQYPKIPPSHGGISTHR